MRLRWTAPAAEDLYSITRYIRRDNPAAAREIAKIICNGTRELVFSPLPYIAVYRVTEDIVEILHIRHGAQNRN